MKHKQIWLLIAILLAFLAPSALFAAEDAEEPTNYVEVGGAGMAVDDEVNRVNEYTVIRDDDGANPYIKARVEGGGDGVHLDLDASRMSQRDQDYNLDADFSRVFKFDAGYQTYKHWLSHDQLDYMRATMFDDTFTGGNPAVYSEDLVPGEDFFLIHRQWEAEGEVAIPDVPNVKLRAGFRKEQREGTEQAIGISHCSACHVEGGAKDIDESTTDITMGASGQFGLFSIDYEYLTRDFDVSDESLSREYLMARAPVINGGGGGNADAFQQRLLFEGLTSDGPVDYDQTPESEKDSHTLKARVDLPKNTVVSATYISADVDSDKTNDVDNLYLSKDKLSTDYDSYSMRASSRLGNWRFSGYGRYEDLDASSNSLRFVNAQGNDVVTTEEKASYESEEARDVTTLGVNAVYRISSSTSA
ncbi:MAG: hypothetical protein JRD88_11790, partial [Deltaproteobacteria bacterium]|nr:hypothetical protein [Deltaproteobacteria bacterium]